MASSNFPSNQLSSDKFVESAGAIIFNLGQKKVCIVRHVEYKEWLLPKGRRNCGESRQQAVLREAQEETGYKCRLLPITMKTRAPPSVELVECPDEAQEYSGLMEPFFLTTRQLGDNNLKLIWWYIAAVDDCEMGQRGFQLPGDEKFE